MGNEQSDRKEIEHLRWLNRVIGAASSSLYLPIALRKASDEIQNLLPHHRASVALSSPGGEVATVYTTVGQTSSLRVGTTIPVSGSNVGSVIEGRVPILKADIEQEPEVLEKNWSTGYGNPVERHGSTLVWRSVHGQPQLR